MKFTAKTIMEKVAGAMMLTLGTDFSDFDK